MARDLVCRRAGTTVPPYVLSAGPVWTDTREDAGFAKDLAEAKEKAEAFLKRPGNKNKVVAIDRDVGVLHCKISERWKRG